MNNLVDLLHNFIICWGCIPDFVEICFWELLISNKELYHWMRSLNNLWMEVVLRIVNDVKNLIFSDPFNQLLRVNCLLRNRLPFLFFYDVINHFHSVNSSFKILGLETHDCNIQVKLRNYFLSFIRLKGSLQ